MNRKKTRQKLIIQWRYWISFKYRYGVFLMANADKQLKEISLKIIKQGYKKLGRKQFTKLALKNKAAIDNQFFGNCRRRKRASK